MSIDGPKSKNIDSLNIMINAIQKDMISRLRRIAPYRDESSYTKLWTYITKEINRIVNKSYPDLVEYWENIQEEKQEQWIKELKEAQEVHQSLKGSSKSR